MSAARHRSRIATHLNTNGHEHIDFALDGLVRLGSGVNKGNELVVDSLKSARRYFICKPTFCTRFFLLTSRALAFSASSKLRLTYRCQLAFGAAQRTNLGLNFSPELRNKLNIDV